MKHLKMVLSLLILSIWLSCVYAWYYVEYQKDMKRYINYVDELKFSPEFVNAFNYAKENWITSAESILKANMDWTITRIEMSKMITVFAMNVLWVKPDLKLDCKFDDVPADLDAKYKYWVTRACQMWLMWYDNDWNKQKNFNPRNNVTRAQLATVLSRMINKAYWRTIKNWDPYYDTHIKYLITQWIIKDYYKPSPDSKEKRWNVMLMLYRADNRNTVTVNYEEWYTKIKPGQIYRNKFYWFQIATTAISWSIISIWKNEEVWWTYVTLYSFIPNQIDWYEIINSFLELEEYKENAKSFKESGNLLHVTLREIIKSWTRKFNEYYNWEEEYNKALNELTETEYYLVEEPWYGIQESPYTTRKKDQEYLDCPLCWPMWYFNHYEFKNLKGDIVY